MKSLGINPTKQVEDLYIKQQCSKEEIEEDTIKWKDIWALEGNHLAGLP